MPPRQRFGRLEVRPAERALWVDGQPAPVGARAFDLLSVLIAHRDRLVTKEELLDAVWPGVVVEENNLQTQVSTLRKLLGRDAIVTIPGHGYRFALAPDTEPASVGAAALPSDAATGTASWAAAALPTRRATLIGRDNDLSALVALLAQHRLVSVLGAGGIGKTALALAAAHARQDHESVAWVELAPVQQAGFVAAAVAQALRLPIGQSDDSLAALVQCLQGHRLLLVLDNAEHLTDAVAGLAQALLAQAPGVRLLVTSQAALHTDGERVFRLEALAVPPAVVPVEAALACGAVALFVDQAQAADRHFRLHEGNVATVIQLCAGLDGLALAIKLAAARLPLLGLEGVAARLAVRLKLLGGGARDAPTRHQTLRAAFDWSHGLLAANEQAVFRRLGVFVGGFSLELAQAAAADDSTDEWAVLDILAALVERSMVMTDGAQRYRLPEIAREYATLKLAEAAELEALQQRHATAVNALMAAAAESYWHTPDQPWVADHAPEIDNLRSALDWAGQHDAALAIRLIGASSTLFLLLGLASEGRRRWLALRPAVESGAAPDAASCFWLEGSRMHWGVSRAAMAEFARRAAQGYRAAGDARGLYLALRFVAVGGQAVGATRPVLDEMAALESPAWPARLRAQRLLAEAGVLRAEDRLVEMCSVLEALLGLATAGGLDAASSFAASALADVHLALGDAAEAARRSRALLAVPRRLSGNYALQVLATLASALLHEPPDASALVEARQAVAEFIALSKSRGWEWFGLYADLFALLAAREGRASAATRLIGHADMQSRRLGERAASAARARALAEAMVTASLAGPVIALLLAEGAHFSEEQAAAAALALSSAD